MTVYVLVVEDDLEFSNELRQVFAELPGATELRVASSRDAAMTLLADSFFDLIVLDLRIPTVDGALDAEPKHGHAVFAHARVIASGTPIFVLTGSPVEDFVPAMLQQKEHVDVWGEGRRIGTIDFLTKLRFEDCPARVGPMVAAVHALAEVELDRGGVNLSIQEERLIRIFAKRSGGVSCKMSRLGGGLSGAKVVRLYIADSTGARIHDAVAKLGSPAEIRDEANRYNSLVTRLDPPATPRMLATLDFGGGGNAGVFYGLADGFEKTGFDVALISDGRAEEAVKGIAFATSRWQAGVPQSRRTIAFIRRRLLTDEVLAEILMLYPMDWVAEFERRHVQTRWACAHGDLHGGNVLISDTGAAVLIDFGDVADGPASLDPVTLELSIICHRLSIPLMGWPSLEQAAQWGNIDVYLDGCPAAEFIRACRSWALAVGAGKREVAAVAYGYLVRQLKYSDTNKELIASLLEGVRKYYDNET